MDVKPTCYFQTENKPFIPFSEFKLAESVWIKTLSKDELKWHIFRIVEKCIGTVHCWKMYRYCAFKLFTTEIRIVSYQIKTAFFVSMLKFIFDALIVRVDDPVFTKTLIQGPLPETEGYF